MIYQKRRVIKAYKQQKKVDSDKAEMRSADTTLQGLCNVNVHTRHIRGQWYLCRFGTVEGPWYMHWIWHRKSVLHFHDLCTQTSRKIPTMLNPGRIQLAFIHTTVSNPGRELQPWSRAGLTSTRVEVNLGTGAGLAQG